MRIVKPEFWTSAQIVECSPIARLLFIGMWNFCDDAGIHPFNVKRLKMEVFPGDDFTAEQIRSMVDELIQVGLLMDYEAEGKQWLMVTGWSHQKIDKPTYRHPQPNSPTTRRALGESSPPDGKGREEDKDSKGEEGKDCAASPPKSPKTHLDLKIPTNLDTPECRKAIDDWLAYKRTRRENYKNPDHLNRQLVGEFGRASPEFFVESVNFCMNQEYKGLFPKKGGNYATRPGRSGPQIGPGQRYDPTAEGGTF